jgi:hypothetical protein
MLGEFGGRLMFGRRIGVAGWDASIAAGHVTELSNQMADLDSLIEARVPVSEAATEIESLPLVIRRASGTELFTEDHSLEENDVILGVGRPSPVRSRPKEPSRIGD